MGLYTTALVRVLKILKRYGTEGKSLCMVGRQQLLMDESSFHHIMNKINILYDDNEYKNLLEEGIIHYDSYRFFKMVGLKEVHAIDVLTSDGADIICDLNEPLPGDLYEKFDYVIDSGTMEHVFDTANAVKNLSKMVKPGGIIIHILAAAGYVDHGFYSYSPGFFYDYYSSNGFDIINLDLEFMISDGKWTSEEYEKKLSVYSPDLRIFDTSPENWGRDDLNGLIHTICKSDEVGHVYIWSVAKKNTSSVNTTYPLQGMYQYIKKMTAEANNKVMDAENKKFDFEKIVQFFKNHGNKKIGIIPAGGDCNEAIKHLYANDLENKVCRVFDNSLEKAGIRIRGGFDVVYPTDKKVKETDLILICSRNYENQIFCELRERGIAETKLIKWSEL